LPQVPWFALRTVYQTSRQQYIERSGDFLVKGYSEWLRNYAFAPVVHPVANAGADYFQENPPRVDYGYENVEIRLPTRWQSLSKSAD
jgi:hypothetical protein